MPPQSLRRHFSFSGSKIDVARNAVMAISVFMRFHSKRDAVMLYESVINEMGRRGGVLPQGEIYHLATLAEDGMFVADLWESRETFDAYAQAKLIPLTVKRGLVSPEVEYGDLHGTIDGACSSTHGISVVAHWDGNAEELLRKYDAVHATIDSANVAAGLVFQWSCKRAGGISLAAHWRSREECAAYTRGAFHEALRSAAMPPPRLNYYDVYNAMDGRRVRV
jgi:hypothetical protein